MTVFITGDRSMSPTYPTLIAVEMLRALAAGEDLVVTDQPGAVSMLTRGLAQQAGVELSTVKPLEGEDLDEFHRATMDAYDITEVVVIHDAPESSSTYKSLARVVADDNKLRLVSYVDLMV